MAHLRKRYIQSLINKVSQLSPLIGILGHRQVGKTTVAEMTAAGYVTLDDRSSLDLALKDPKKFIEQHQVFLQAIDECQYAPSLFPALKEHVRKNKKPGQYLLTGSVRFTSRAAIKESLTGRIVNFELLPLTISELAHEPLPQTLAPFFEKSSIDKIIQVVNSKKNKINQRSKEYKYYFEHGGLPGICFIQNKKLRELKVKEQLSTILERDIRQVYPTNLPNSQILDFLQYIAQQQGRRFNYSDAKKKIGITMPTQKKLLYALESIFLIRRLKVEGSYSGEIYYLEDQAESLQLSQNILSHFEYYEQLVYRNLRAQLFYNMGLSFKEFSYETRGGVRIPYAIECEGYNLAILPIKEEMPNRSEKAAAASFLKTYNNSRILFLHQNRQMIKIDEKSISAPIFYFV
jgi:predicted AAA+ superfamily ATPase